MQEQVRVKLQARAAEPSRSRASKKCTEHFQLHVWSPALISFDKSNFLFK